MKNTINNIFIYSLVQQIIIEFVYILTLLINIAENNKKKIYIKYNNNIYTYNRVRYL